MLIATFRCFFLPFQFQEKFDVYFYGRIFLLSVKSENKRHSHIEGKNRISSAYPSITLEALI